MALEPRRPDVPLWRASSAKWIRTKSSRLKTGRAAHWRPAALTSSNAHSAALSRAAAVGRHGNGK